MGVGGNLLLIERKDVEMEDLNGRDLMKGKIACQNASYNIKIDDCNKLHYLSAGSCAQCLI